MSNTCPYLPAFLSAKPTPTAGTLYLAQAPCIRRITTPLPAMRPEAYDSARATVTVSSDFAHDAITEVDIEVEVDLSELERCDTVRCGPPRPQPEPGWGYCYRGSKDTDIDLLLSFQWKSVPLLTTGEEEYVGEAYIFGVLCYVWRRESTGEFIAQSVPPEEL